MSDKLKPCPFCGEIPRAYPVGVCGRGVLCETSDCALWSKPIYRDKWQRRARDPVMDKLLEACNAVLAAFSLDHWTDAVAREMSSLRDAVADAKPSAG